MAVPQNKQQLIDAITLSHRRLMADLESIAPEHADARTLAGHAQGTWMSAGDLVAYLIGWHSLVLDWYAGRARGEGVSFPAAGFKWNELGRLAQKFYADYADLPFAVKLQRLAQAHQQVLTLVQGLSDAELYGAPWYEKYTLGRMIQLNTSSPNTNARNRIRQWKKHQGG